MNKELVEDPWSTRLTVDLWILDALLTGRDPRCGRGHPTETPIVDVFSFYTGELYYLSDGGYSRVYYPGEEGPLSLDSVSWHEVKAAWSDSHVKSVCVRIEETLKAYRESLEAAVRDQSG